jgi:hypothetical protein
MGESRTPLSRPASRPRTGTAGFPSRPRRGRHVPNGKGLTPALRVTVSHAHVLNGKGPHAHVLNGKGLTPALRVTVSHAHAHAHVPRKGSQKHGPGSPLFQGFRVS